MYVHISIKKTSPKCQINADDLDPNYEENFKLPNIENPHEWVPNASKKIEIQFSSKYGRYLVAAEDISPGMEDISSISLNVHT